MAIAIRGTTPATSGTTSNPVSVTLNGGRQPQTNDVLIIVHSNDFYAATNMPTPTVGGSSVGVVAIGTADKGTNEAHAKTYSYVVGSTGDLTVSVTETGSADEEKALMVYVLSGADTTTPVDASAHDSTGGGSTTPICPTVSPTSSDAYLICHTSSGPQNTGAYTPPGSMSETYDFMSGGAHGNGGAVEQLSASGATGTRTFTAANSHSWIGVSIAVKTATGGGGGPEQMPRAVIVAG